MLVADYDIVFQEVPNETTLALNISDCPHHCPGCHSSYLWQPVGETLTTTWLQALLDRYPYLTCVSIQGGDRDYHEVERVASWIKQKGLKSCWYTGFKQIPEDLQLKHFDFIKVGPYIEALGGLRARTTNQRFYRVEHIPAGYDTRYELHDLTDLFWTK
ncbi:MAG: 4Fe-4S cluster-binding domain-containing protein [Paludibacteraceae bacterium]|nr:4Fe-4S cluster-binding domain-containing protein [Paludibacteraceae bacterium]